MRDTVKEPIDFRENGTFVGLVESGLEIRQSRLIGLVDGEGIHQILNVVRLQLRNARIQHHIEQRYEEGRVFSQGHVRLPAQVPKAGKLGRLDVVGFTPAVASGDDHDEVFRQDEGRPLASDAQPSLVMTEKVTEVDVEYSPFPVDHDVGRMSVADAEDERRYAIAGAGKRKVV